MSPLGGDQLTVALNPSKICTTVGLGTDLGASERNIRQIETTEPNNSMKKHEKHVKLGGIKVKGNITIKKRKKGKKAKQ